MEGAAWDQLHLFYKGCVASAVERRAGIALAIEEGAAHQTSNGVDEIEEVRHHLAREALNAPESSAWHSRELAALVPLDDPDGTGFPCVPTVGEVGKSAEDAKEAWCWALKMGYARDRVIAYARVKQAMLDVHNLSGGPEVHTALFRVFGRANAGLREAELALTEPRTVPRSDPATDIAAMRRQWARMSEDVPNAQRQQPTLLRTPLVTGLTAREVDARARDPMLEQPATYAVGASTLAQMPARDALMGTETFVSLTFPATDHEELYAVGASALGVRTGEHDWKMPALVTLHNATGAVEPICRRMGESCAFNVFMTDDAATLLADLHSLIVEARRSASHSQKGEALPLEAQRNYLLLEHATL